MDTLDTFREPGCVRGSGGDQGSKLSDSGLTSCVMRRSGCLIIRHEDGLRGDKKGYERTHNSDGRYKVLWASGNRRDGRC